MSDMKVTPIGRIQYNAKQFYQHDKEHNKSTKKAKFPDKSIFEVALEGAKMLEKDKDTLNMFRKAVYKAL